MSDTKEKLLAKRAELEQQLSDNAREIAALPPPPLVSSTFIPQLLTEIGKLVQQVSYAAPTENDFPRWAWKAELSNVERRLVDVRAMLLERLGQRRG